MKEIKGDLLQDISGGSLTSIIMDYFRDQSSAGNMQTQEWQSSSTILSPALGKGEQFGEAIVTGITAIALFSVTLAGRLFEGLFR